MTHCKECGVPLVQKPHIKVAGHHKPFVMVFQTYRQDEGDLVKGFLRAHGIPFVTTGDATAPFGMDFIDRLPTTSDPAGMQIFVPPDYADETMKLLSEADKRKRDA